MELEAKWEPKTPLTVAEIEACDWQPYHLGQRELLRQINRYFDTAEHDLGRAQRSLRLRDENGNLILTTKGGSGTEDGVHARDEHEAPVTSTDPVAWPGEIMAPLHEFIGDRPLTPFLRIENGRQAWPVLRDDAVVGELALDSATIFAGERRGSIHEIEWELKGGTPEDFEAVRSIINTRLPVQPSNVTKLQRGLALLEPATQGE